MASIVMEAEPRSSFGKGPNRRLRAAGKVPAILYGNGEAAVALAVDPKEVVGVIRSHGGVNTIFELRVKGVKGRESVMIKDYQLEPVGHRLLHTDLIRVAMDKELSLHVSVELTGTAVGVKTGGGMLDFVTRTVEVACLPKDIPETLVIDVSKLDIGDYIRAAELPLPKGVALISDPNVVIAHVLAPRAEAVAEEEEASLEGAEAAAGSEGEGGAPKEESSKEGPAKD